MKHTQMRCQQFWNLMVDLKDGRTISVPLMYYPRLYYGESTEREHWVIEEEGIHWPELDEDIRTADLLIGLPSAESQASLRRWLDARKKNVSAGEAQILQQSTDSLQIEQTTL